MAKLPAPILALSILLTAITAKAEYPVYTFNPNNPRATAATVLEGNTQDVNTQIVLDPTIGTITSYPTTYSQQRNYIITGDAVYGVDYRIRAWASPFDTSQSYITPKYNSNGSIIFTHTTFVTASGHDNAIHIETIHNNVIYPKNRSITIQSTQEFSTDNNGAFTATIQEIDELTPNPNARLNGISTRGLVGAGNNVMVVGFITQGVTNKTLLMRGVGPSLSSYGVLDPISDPYIALYDSSSNLVESNDNWANTQNASQIIQIGQQPASPTESAILDTFSPGLRTLILKNNGTGTIGLAEVWDISNDLGSKITAVSTRALIGSGNQVAVAGFSITNGPERVIITGKGPELANYGISNYADGLTLRLYDSSNALVESNSSWASAWNANAISQNPQHPALSSEPAIDVVLPSGMYTVQLSANSEGVGIVEVYEF